MKKINFSIISLVLFCSIVFLFSGCGQKYSFSQSLCNQVENENIIKCAQWFKSNIPNVTNREAQEYIVTIDNVKYATDLITGTFYLNDETYDYYYNSSTDSLYTSKDIDIAEEIAKQFISDYYTVDTQDILIENFKFKIPCNLIISENSVEDSPESYVTEESYVLGEYVKWDSSYDDLEEVVQDTLSSEDDAFNNNKITVSIGLAEDDTLKAYIEENDISEVYPNIEEVNLTSETELVGLYLQK